MKINFLSRSIELTAKEMREASKPYTREYSDLIRLMRELPDYEITVKHRYCATSANRGLTYEYMEHYILTHESKETVLEVLDEYNELRLIAECHSKYRRYPVIKRWFLAKYPEIVEFGLLKVQPAVPQKPAMAVVNPAQEQKIGA